VKAEQIDLIRYRLDRARESLAEARLLLNENHANTCVNRLYYACFYAVTALLLTQGKASARHSGVRAMFDSDWVKTGVAPVEMGRFYRRLFDSRQESDYGDFVRFDVATAEAWLGQETEFVHLIGRLCEQAIGKRSEI
jgi:hypothetical protein